MGADLYIRKISDKLREEWNPKFDAAVKARDALPKDSKAAERAQKKVMAAYDGMFSDGYFRDSYNTGNVLWTLGLSWWNDVIPMLEDGNLTPVKAKELADRIRATRQKLPTAEELKKGNATVSAKGENSLAAWHRYFRRRRKDLLAFLDKAVGMGEPISCSL